MIDNLKKVLAGFAALAALALGGSAIAGATGDGSGSGSGAATEQVTEEESGREGENDAAAQAAACETAGVDPSAENVEFDDETGECELESGDENEDEGPESEEGPEGNE